MGGRHRRSMTKSGARGKLRPIRINLTTPLGRCRQSGISSMEAVAPKWRGHAANLKRLAACADLATKAGDEASAKRYREQAQALERTLSEGGK